MYSFSFLSCRDVNSYIDRLLGWHYLLSNLQLSFPEPTPACMGPLRRPRYPQHAGASQRSFILFGKSVRVNLSVCIVTLIFAAQYRSVWLEWVKLFGLEWLVQRWEKSVPKGPVGHRSWGTSHSAVSANASSSSPCTTTSTNRIFGNGDHESSQNNTSEGNDAVADDEEEGRAGGTTLDGVLLVERRGGPEKNGSCEEEGVVTNVILQAAASQSALSSEGAGVGSQDT